MELVGLPADAECIGVLDASKIKIDPEWAFRIPAQMAYRRQMLPFAFADGCVHVACVNVKDGASLQAIAKLVGCSVRAEPTEPQSLQRALDRIYGDPQAAAAAQPRGRSVDLRRLGDLGPDDVVGLCDELLHAALVRNASDIHIDADPEGLVVRLRVDGALEHYRKLPAGVTSGVISRFKVLGGLDIAEKRASQDGAFRHRYGRAGQTVDLRIATLPTRHGERMTLRFLGIHTENLTLERLGMGEDDLACFNRAIDFPHGMLLLTGPTGSGKTTTLYAAIRRLMATEDLNILTVEDPIESEIRGIAQAEVDQADKVTFHNALRSLLRHDPDVIMIGEIRDAETADVAVKASLTDTWSSAPCTPTRHSALSRGWRTWGWTAFWWRPPFAWRSPSGWCGGCARAAASRAS
jgi:type IV pilus assembly protein PilB